MLVIVIVIGYNLRGDDKEIYSFVAHAATD